MPFLREEGLLVCGEVHRGAAGPAQGPAGSPADLPLVLQRGGKSGADGIGPAARGRGCFPVQPGDGGYREVLDLRDCKSGMARSGDRCEALRALLREGSKGRCAGGRGGMNKNCGPCEPDDLMIVRFTW